MKLIRTMSASSTVGRQTFDDGWSVGAGKAASCKNCDVIKKIAGHCLSNHVRHVGSISNDISKAGGYTAGDGYPDPCVTISLHLTSAHYYLSPFSV